MHSIARPWRSLRCAWPSGPTQSSVRRIPETEDPGLGVHEGVAEIVDLVEVPHEHLRKCGVLRVFAGGPQQLGAQQITQVGVVLDAQVAVKGILYVLKYWGLARIKRSEASIMPS